MSDYMEDCIHLHACRRICKIAKDEYKKQIKRNCTESCQAYTPGDAGNYISVEEAVNYAIDGSSSIERGYDAYDVYCASDLQGRTISDIIDEITE